MQTAIDYAPQLLDPKTLIRVRAFYRTALFCAILPMVVGVSILLLYWATLFPGLATSGFFFLPVGMCFFLVGLAFVITGFYYERKSSRLNLNPPAKKKRLVLALCLLLANFPLAIGCAAAGIFISTITYIDVVNETGATIDSCIVTVPGDRTEVHDLAPGARFRARLRAQGDGVGEVVVAQGGKSATIHAIDYLSGGGGEHVRVHLHPGLNATVDKLR